MKFPLYEQVALAVDVPEFNLKKGDIATLVETVPHPAGGENGCVLEVFNALGASIAVVTVPESHLEPLRADEVLTVRHMAKAI
ncbi:MAG: DUF4926 domain-containing protein [Nitrospinae bacterium]|nr:DUF4926 domain-containing protein [Nitrospinota bacterium]